MMIALETFDGGANQSAHRPKGGVAKARVPAECRGLFNTADERNLNANFGAAAVKFCHMPIDTLQHGYYGKEVKIVSIRHKGLARLFDRDDSSKLDQRIVGKIRVQMTFLTGMEHSDEFRNLAFWKAHQLSDSRWSFHVTANYRLTFEVDDAAQEIRILDLEDYH